MNQEVFNFVILLFIVRFLDTNVVVSGSRQKLRARR